MTAPASKAAHLDHSPVYLSITVVKGDALKFLIKAVYLHEDPASPGNTISEPADLNLMTWESDIIDANSVSVGKFTFAPAPGMPNHVQATISGTETGQIAVGAYRHWVKWHDNHGLEKTAYAGPFNVVARGHGVAR